METKEVVEDETTKEEVQKEEETNEVLFSEAGKFFAGEGSIEEFNKWVGLHRDIEFIIEERGDIFCCSTEDLFNRVSEKNFEILNSIPVGTLCGKCPYDGKCYSCQ